MTKDLGSYSLPQLKQLSARITKEIAKQESVGKAAVLKKLHKMAREHGLTLDEVLGGGAQAKARGVAPAKSPAIPKAPLPVKYRHPSKRDLAWSGRGRKPQWVAAWLANGGALEALANAARKFEKKQHRKADTLADTGTTEATAGRDDAAQADTATTAA